MKAKDLLLRETEVGCLLRVKVVPRSSKNQVVGIENGSLKLKVQAPPEDGAANAAVVRFLAGLLDVPASAVVIQKGNRSRQKLLFLRGLKEARIIELLEAH